MNVPQSFPELLFVIGKTTITKRSAFARRSETDKRHRKAIHTHKGPLRHPPVQRELAEDRANSETSLTAQKSPRRSLKGIPLTYYREEPLKTAVAVRSFITRLTTDFIRKLLDFHLIFVKPERTTCSAKRTIPLNRYFLPFALDDPPSSTPSPPFATLPKRLSLLHPPCTLRR